jgi:hypothetical protein
VLLQAKKDDVCHRQYRRGLFIETI